MQEQRFEWVVEGIIAHEVSIPHQLRLVVEARIVAVLGLA